MGKLMRCNVSSTQNGLHSAIVEYNNGRCRVMAIMPTGNHMSGWKPGRALA
jgi:hypothetical protein